MAGVEADSDNRFLNLLWWNSDHEEWEVKNGVTPEALEQAAEAVLRERFKQKVLELRRGCLPITDAGTITACDELLRWLEAGS